MYKIYVYPYTYIYITYISKKISWQSLHPTPAACPPARPRTREAAARPERRAAKVFFLKTALENHGIMDM